MNTTTLQSAAVPAPAPASSHRPGELALIFQEAFTVAVRLRSNRQVAPDATSFRTRIKQLLGSADQEARRAGYAPEAAKLAVYAFVAFLDESVLNSRQPMFADWPRQPLQEEVFGDHMAGETFFRYLDDLLAQQDSGDLADLLEIFQLCLLLGFRGRYGVSGASGLQALTAAVHQKIARVRGARGELSPSWRPPAEAIAASRDPWVRRLGIVAAATLVVAVLLFAVYTWSLHAGMTDLRAVTATLTR